MDITELKRKLVYAVLLKKVTCITNIVAIIKPLVCAGKQTKQMLTECGLSNAQPRFYLSKTPTPVD